MNDQNDPKGPSAPLPVGAQTEEQAESIITAFERIQTTFQAELSSRGIDFTPDEIKQMANGGWVVEGFVRYEETPDETPMTVWLFEDGRIEDLLG